MGLDQSFLKCIGHQKEKGPHIEDPQTSAYRLQDYRVISSAFSASGTAPGSESSPSKVLRR